MTLISHYEAFGEKFEIEPPIEVGDYFVDSLGKLAVIAANGHDSDPRIIEAMAGSFNNSVDRIYKHRGAERMAWFVTEYIAMRDRVHTFTRSK